MQSDYFTPDMFNTMTTSSNTKGASNNNNNNNNNNNINNNGSNNNNHNNGNINKNAGIRINEGGMFDNLLRDENGQLIFTALKKETNPTDLYTRNNLQNYNNSISQSQNQNSYDYYPNTSNNTNNWQGDSANINSFIGSTDNLQSLYNVESQNNSNEYLQNVSQNNPVSYGIQQPSSTILPNQEFINSNPNQDLIYSHPMTSFDQQHVVQNSNINLNNSLQEAAPTKKRASKKIKDVISANKASKAQSSKVGISTSFDKKSHDYNFGQSDSFPVYKKSTDNSSTYAPNYNGQVQQQTQPGVNNNLSYNNTFPVYTTQFPEINSQKDPIQREQFKNSAKNNSIDNQNSFPTNYYLNTYPNNEDTLNNIYKAGQQVGSHNQLPQEKFPISNPTSQASYVQYESPNTQEQFLSTGNIAPLQAQSSMNQAYSKKATTEQNPVYIALNQSSAYAKPPKSNNSNDFVNITTDQTGVKLVDIPLLKEKDPISAIRLRIAHAEREYSNNSLKLTSRISEILQSVPEESYAKENPDLRTVALSRCIMIGSTSPEIWQHMSKDIQLLARFNNWLRFDIKAKRFNYCDALLGVLSKLPLDYETLQRLKFIKPIDILEGKKIEKSTKSLIVSIKQNAKLLSEKKKQAGSNATSNTSQNKNDNNSNANATKNDKGTENKSQISSNHKPNSFKPISGAPANTGSAKVTKPSLPGQKSSTNSGFFKKLERPMGNNNGKSDSEKKNPAAKPRMPSTMSFSQIRSSMAPKEKPASANTDHEAVPTLDLLNANRKRKRKSVTWKSDSDLVSVRTFECDPSERVSEFTKKFASIRDMEKSEGRLAFSSSRALLEADGDKSFGESNNKHPSMVSHQFVKPQRKFTTPRIIDFANISWYPSFAQDGNVVTRGGLKIQVNSSESAVQAEREKKVLMTFYNSPSEIPDNPKFCKDIESNSPATVEPVKIPIPEIWLNNPEYKKWYNIAYKKVYGEYYFKDIVMAPEVPSNLNGKFDDFMKNLNSFNSNFDAAKAINMFLAAGAKPVSGSQDGEKLSSDPNLQNSPETLQILSNIFQQAQGGAK